MVKRTKKTTIAPAPTNEETPREKFERLMVARMNRILNSIRLLGNLANPAYEYHDQDIAKARDAILEALGIALDRFRPHKRAETPLFTLEDENKR